MLYIFGGLPGTGKSTLSLSLARALGALHLRIDSIEQAIRNVGGTVTGAEGYSVGYLVAGDNLRLGHPVIADSVNPLSVTREAWRDVALGAKVPFLEVEVICSDPEEHRRRVESREQDIPGHTHPTWEQVVNREYEAWDRPHIVIDTAGRTPEQSLIELLDVLKTYRR